MYSNGFCGVQNQKLGLGYMFSNVLGIYVNLICILGFRVNIVLSQTLLIFLLRSTKSGSDRTGFRDRFLRGFEMGIGLCVRVNVRVITQLKSTQS